MCNVKEGRVVDKCRICSRLEIEGHTPEKLAQELRSHATWLMDHNMTVVAMRFKDAAAMLEHLANDRAVVEKFMERIATRDQLEFIIAGLEEDKDELLDPVQRGANEAARSLAVTLTRYMEEGGEIDDELMLQICGTLSEHIEARKDKAAEDIRDLWDLCFERTLHLLDDDDKQMLREKGLLK
jgi:hypothetical protein